MNRRLRQIALGRPAATEDHRLALLGLRLGLVADDGRDHRLDHASRAQEDLGCRAFQAQGSLQVDRAGVQLGRATQRGELRLAVAACDQVLQRAAAAAVGQIGHVEDDAFPVLVHLGGDQIGPVREEDVTWRDLAQALRCEVFPAGDQMKRLAGALGQALGRDRVPGARCGNDVAHDDPMSS